MKYIIIFAILASVGAAGIMYGGTMLIEAERNALEALVRAALLDSKVRTTTTQEQSLELFLAGDIMLSRAVGEYISQTNDPTFPFQFVAETIKHTDIAFANLEGPISSQGKNQGSKYSFRAEPRVVEGLVYAGFDVLSLANNHIWDWGVDALRDTIQALSKEHMIGIGAGTDSASASAPAIITSKGVKVGWLAYTDLYPESLWAEKEHAGVHGFTLEGAIQDINVLRAQTDIVVVSLHWGQEYETTSTDAQKEIARTLVDAGADIIAGHHPHVVQEVERYTSKKTKREGVIFYSLGNFVFDQPFSQETMSSIAAKVRVQKNGVQKIEIVPVTITKEYRPTFEITND
jgi:poly-gamma-glutamate synthesis protein (capsule biosynthesis protein)